MSSTMPRLTPPLPYRPPPPVTIPPRPPFPQPMFHPPSPQIPNPNPHSTSRLPKLPFNKFNGENPRLWHSKLREILQHEHCRSLHVGLCGFDVP